MNGHCVFLLLPLLLLLSHTAEAQVQSCYVCTGDSDATTCADGKNLDTKNCESPDHNNEYCYAERIAGRWERDCCSGTEENCKEIHTVNPDGSTMDRTVCHTDLCNNMNPAAESAHNGEKIVVASFLATLLSLALMAQLV